MKVSELMKRDIVCAAESTPLMHIAAEMKKNNIGTIPVCNDSGHLLGLITDRDIVLRGLAGTRDFTTLKASDIMSSDPVTVTPSMSIHDAALILAAKQIRRLPVTESSKLVGMLTLGDIAVKPVLIDEAGDVLSSVSLTAGMRE